MNVKLYSCADDVRKINKTLVPKSGDISVNLKADTSIINPMITLKLPSGLNLQDFNMVSMFGYNYFVNDAIYIQGSLIELRLEIDELSTFKNEIMSLNVFIERAENEANKDIYDPEVSLITTKTIEEERLGSFGTAIPKTYLVVSGGS